MMALMLGLGLLAPAEFAPQWHEVAPVSVSQRADGVWFVDFGAAWYGTIELRAEVAAPVELMIAVGEKLSAPDALDTKPPGSVIYRQTPLTLAPGQAAHRPTWAPIARHNDPAAVHVPAGWPEITVFRAAEIRGWPGQLVPAQVRLIALSVPFDAAQSSFDCSDPALTAVWELCRHTIEATTAFSVYIDGERERIPYEADAYINQLSHYAVQAEYETARRTFRHLLAKPTWPTEWALHMPLVAHADWQATGSAALADENWDALVGKLLRGKARADGLLVAGGIIDWPAGERDGFGCGLKDESDGRQIGPMVNSVVNAFGLAALAALAELADATGRGDQAIEFRAQYARALPAFQAAFYDPARGVYIDGEGCDHASLHANMLPLAFGLVPEEARRGVAEFVVSRGMACSVYGAQYLLDGLFAAGRETDAVALLRSDGPRSWVNMLAQGTTMTMEAWNAPAKPNLTWNHAWGAVPANAISRWVLGVQPVAPGYRVVSVAPRLGDLVWVRGRVPTPHGAIDVEVDRRRGLFRIVAPPGVEVLTPTAPVGGPVKVQLERRATAW